MTAAGAEAAVGAEIAAGAAVAAGAEAAVGAEIAAGAAVVAGAEVEEMKIKADTFVAILNRNFGALNNPEIKQVKDIIGLHISPSYDKFGNVADFTLAIPEKKKG